MAATAAAPTQDRSVRVAAAVTYAGSTAVAARPRRPRGRRDGPLVREHRDSSRPASLLGLEIGVTNQWDEHIPD